MMNFDDHSDDNSAYECGECNNCGETGIIGNYCVNCEDSGMIYTEHSSIQHDEDRNAVEHTDLPMEQHVHEHILKSTLQHELDFFWYDC
jgi:hypothetical protein